eukprot:TRINITY_DN1201_c0_g4_i1.p1 TRINITY_DN1201_c0_g4~~TRINITY_DN1201_c0_g4_i1.p1  ORF type:complete len:1363 (+),score=276.30 TRINITY_DN1201_c0_g4_i1:87-4175(+)
MQDWTVNAILLLLLTGLLSEVQLVEGQCRLTCLQTGNEQIEPSSYSNVWSPSSLVFIMDTTESMINEIDLVQREVNSILSIIQERAEAKACNAINDYIIYPFNDPQVGPMYHANTTAGFQENYALVQGQVRGGGDCPEPVLTAVLNVLSEIADNSFVFIFTDGAAKDARLKLEVIRRIQQTNSYVVFVLIGDHCANEGLDYISSQLYSQISHASGGNAIFVKRTESTVGNVVKLISLFVKPKSVLLIDINQFTPSDCIDIPVDSSLCDLVVTVSNPSFQKVGKATLQSGSETVRHKVKSRSLKAWEIDGPTTGGWQICFGRPKGRELSLQVRGSSDIEFRVILKDILTREEVVDVSGGEEVRMELTVFGIPANKVQTVDFIDLGGNSVLSILGLNKRSSIITVVRVTLPSGIFKIRIKGTDNRQNPFQRISNGIFGQPNEPTWVVEPPSRVYAVLRNNFTIEAVVTGKPFPSVVWMKDGVVVKVNNRIGIEREGTLTLTRVLDTDVGAYTITATNHGGSITKDIDLGLWTAPYFTREPEREYVRTVNRPVIISLNPQGNPPPSCRWLYKGAAIQGIGQTQCSLRIGLLNELTCGEYRVIIENSVATLLLSITVTFNPICFLDTCHYQPPVSGSKLKLQTNCIGCPTRCEWLRNGVELSTGSKYSIYRNCSLHIKNFQSADRGSYKLNLLDSDGSTADRKTLKVIPSESVSIIEPSWEERLVQVSTDYSVVCQAVGSPPPVLTWSRNDRPINKATPSCTDSTVQSLELSFERIQKASEGEYKCTATNKFDTVEKVITINVNSTLDVDVTPEEVDAIIGDTLLIDCRITNRGHLTPTVNWYKQNIGVVRNERIRIFSNNTLRFRPVLAEDEDRYECRAVTTRERTSGYSEVSPVPKTFFYSPLDLDTVCIVCPTLAGANPSWNRRGNLLVNNNKYVINSRRRELCINGADCGDEGTYTCESTHAVPVRLRDRQQVCENLVRQRPRIRYRQPSLVVIEGRTARMVCRVSGLPRPTIKWFKNGDQPILDTSRITLAETSSYTAGDTSFVYESVVEITDITLGDQGKYTCNSSHPELGYANHTFIMQVTLGVDAVVPELVGNSENQKLCEGESFVVFCRFESNLPISRFRWYHNSTQVNTLTGYVVTNQDSQTTLQVHNSVPSHTGQYRCEATNILGRTGNTIYVRVNENRAMTIASFSGNTVAYVGESLTLFCRVGVNSQDAEIKWYKDGALAGTGERLIFDPVVVGIGGYYRCRVSGCGHSSGKSLLLEVRNGAPPIITYMSADTVNEGDPAYLHCVTTGDPEPTITWKKRDRTLKENRRISFFSNGTMVISPTYEMIDSDMYKCCAENSHGAVCKRIVLTVVYR